MYHLPFVCGLVHLMNIFVFEICRVNLNDRTQTVLDLKVHHAKTQQDLDKNFTNDVTLNVV